MARAITKEYGPGTDAVQGALSTTPDSHATRKAHTVLSKTGLALGIKKTLIREGSCKGLTVLKLSDVIRYMVEKGHLSRLYGGLNASELKPVLASFWQRFQRIHPELEIFEAFASGKARPETTIPCFTHGDEGRGTPYS